MINVKTAKSSPCFQEQLVTKRRTIIISDVMNSLGTRIGLRSKKIINTKSSNKDVFQEVHALYDLVSLRATSSPFFSVKAIISFLISYREQL